MKRRTLTIVVGLLLCLSLIGVGFASWVISAKDEETIIGNVEVQTVTDRRLDITVKSLSYAGTNPDYLVAGDSNKIIFGMPSDGEMAAISNPWLTNDNGTKENLQVSFTVEVAYKTVADISSSDITFEAEHVIGAGVQGLIDVEYLEAKDVVVVEVVNDNATGDGEDTKKVTYTVTLEFDWGKDFNNENPYLYYNKLDVATYGNAAYDALNAINSLEGFTYTLKLTVDKK